MASNVSFIFGKDIHTQCSKIEHIHSRGSMVIELIKAYGLGANLRIVNSRNATDDELWSFHSRKYINYLKNHEESTSLKSDEEDDQYGLGYDCPIIENIYSFAKLIVGGSLTAANELIEGRALHAINWYGGWHHAQRDKAGGFCYVNDIVCAIHKLRGKFNKIMYIDFDIHHGDGVQNAFEFSPSVLTLSFHKYEPGFYPGTGALGDIGKGNGKYYTVNVPLKTGIRDEAYTSLFDSVAEAAFHIFQPDAIVAQCGADCLNNDTLGSFNLTLYGLGHCVRKVLSWNLPTIFLGGGGYNLPNVARCWTYLTSVTTSCDISSDIPENAFFTHYGPDFDLHISQGNRPDENDKKYLQKVEETILDNLSKIALHRIHREKIYG